MAASRADATFATDVIRAARGGEDRVRPEIPRGVKRFSPGLRVYGHIPAPPLSLHLLPSVFQAGPASRRSSAPGGERRKPGRTITLDEGISQTVLQPARHCPPPGCEATRRPLCQRPTFCLSRPSYLALPLCRPALSAGPAEIEPWHRADARLQRRCRSHGLPSGHLGDADVLGLHTVLRAHAQLLWVNVRAARKMRSPGQVRARGNGQRPAALTGAV